MTKTNGGLSSLRVDGLTVRHSFGADDRAAAIAARTARVLKHLRSVFGEAPEVEVFVVDPEDWDAVGEGVPYGMPLAVPGKVVAPTRAAEWFIEHFRSLDGMPEALADPVEMTAFVDCVVAHELTHLTEAFDPTTWASSLGPMWVSELYANLGMWAYFAQEEPAELHRIAQLADASRAAGAHGWPVRDLDRMPESLQHSAGHYVWFQMLLILLARQIWETTGPPALAAYRSALHGKSLSPTETVAALDEISPGLAQRLHRWPAI